MPLTNIDIRTAIMKDPGASEVVLLAPDAAIATDLAQSPGLREQALIGLLPGPAAFVDETAVFVHTGIWTINPLALSRPQCAPLPGASTRWATDRRVLRESHVVGRTTTMARTIADLLHRRDPVRFVAPILRLIEAGADVEEALSVLGTHFRGQPTSDLRQMLRQIHHAHQAAWTSSTPSGDRRRRHP